MREMVELHHLNQHVKFVRVSVLICKADMVNKQLRSPTVNKIYLMRGVIIKTHFYMIMICGVHYKHC